MNVRHLMLCLAMLASGCGGGGSDPAPPANSTTVASISISPATVTLMKGESLQLSAILKNANGQVIENKTVNWESRDLNKVTVSAAGVVQAVSSGTAAINASVDGKSASSQVLVNDPPAVVSRIELNTLAAHLEEGATVQLIATAYDSAGGTITGRGEAWSADEAGIAQVTPGGLVTGLRPGVATVAVLIDGVRTSAAIQVFAEHSHDLIHGGAVVGEQTEAYSIDLRDPTANSVSFFGAGKRASHPTPSPQGDRIAFVVYGNWDPDRWQTMIYVANRDGSGASRLTFLPARNDAPVWSPDGTRIAFSSQPLGAGAEVWIMNADGSGLANLTADQTDSSESAPAWSPAMAGGPRIAYTRRLNGLGQLWTMKADGSDKHAVTNDAQFDDDEASWSPDGQTLVFRRSGVGVFSDLYLVSSAGGAGRALVPAFALPSLQLSPAWSPDGKLIAFASNHGDGQTYQLWTVWADGTRLAQRTFGDMQRSDPAWILRD